MIQVRLITPFGARSIEVSPGAVLLEALQAAGVEVDARCGGRGVCGRCRVRLLKGHFSVQGREFEIPPGEERDALSCATLVLGGPAEMAIGQESLISRQAKAHAGFELPEFTLQPGVQRFAVQVQLSNDDTTCRALAEKALVAAGGPDDVHWPMPLLRNLEQMLQQDGGRVVITVAHHLDHVEVMDLMAGTQCPPLRGLAVDIGTTTVAAALVDFEEGVVISRASNWNAQLKAADDVASRISYSLEPGHLQRLQDQVVGTLNELIAELECETGCGGDCIIRVAIAGNTVMTHLFLGLPVASLGCLPFRPVARRFDAPVASELGLAVHPRARVDVLPAISGYVGGDIVADLYAGRLHQRGGRFLLIDIGTNGEIVLSENGRMTTCATAAGPAFEGYGMACGCRASDGAIEHIRMAEDLQADLQIIGGGADPIGLCGSAIVDFMAWGLRRGAINTMGRFDLERLKACGVYMMVEDDAGPVHAWKLADTPRGPLYVSEADVAQVLKAKAAIYAGMRVLLKQQNLEFSDLDALVLAGGFARHLDITSAITMGMLPELPLPIYQQLGNGSLAGAFLALTERHALPACEKLSKRPIFRHLNQDADFAGTYQEALAMPYLEPDEFPLLAQELGL